MHEETDEDLLGPGSDLAISFSGILIIFLIIILSLSLLQGKRNQHAKQVLDEKKIELSNSSQIMNDIQTRIDQLNLELRKKKSELGLQVTKTFMANARISILETKLSDLTEQINKLKEFRETAINLLSQRDLSIEKLEAQISDIKPKHDFLAHNLQAQTVLNSSLKKKIEQLQNHLSIQEEIMENQKDGIAQQNEVIKEKEKEISKDKDKIGIYKKLINENSTLINSIKNELNIKNDKIWYLQNQISKLNDKPPVITIDDTKAYSFESGQAKISNWLHIQLKRTTVPTIRANARKFNAYVVEVIGHTDETPLGRKDCNMDQKLLSTLEGYEIIDNLKPCDNTGLGMARAISVVKELKKLGLRYPFVLRPLSAGQTTMPSGRLAHPNSNPKPQANRRRIEIRLRQLDCAPNCKRRNNTPIIDGFPKDSIALAF